MMGKVAWLGAVKSRAGESYLCGFGFRLGLLFEGDKKSVAMGKLQ
jgi:hypothetical protein